MQSRTRLRLPHRLGQRETRRDVRKNRHPSRLGRYVVSAAPRGRKPRVRAVDHRTNGRCGRGAGDRDGGSRGAANRFVGTDADPRARDRARPAAGDRGHQTRAVSIAYELAPRASRAGERAPGACVSLTRCGGRDGGVLRKTNTAVRRAIGRFTRSVLRVNPSPFASYISSDRNSWSSKRKAKPRPLRCSIVVPSTGHLNVPSFLSSGTRSMVWSFGQTNQVCEPAPRGRARNPGAVPKFIPSIRTRGRSGPTTQVCVPS